MTAHIVNTQIDKKGLPATLSKQSITDLLRKELHFKGVVFSDDMHMKAISAEYSFKEAIEKAINAGVDVLLFSGNIPDGTPITGSSLVNIILELIKEKKLSVKSIEASYRRIMQLKHEHNALVQKF